MARDVPCTTIRENHGPRNVGCAAPKFAIVEVCQPPQHHPHRDIDRDIITHAQERQIAALCHPANRDQHADQAAVKTHPAFPQLEHVERIVPQARLVKDRIADPAAQNDTQCAVEEQVIGVALRQRRTGRFDHLGQMPIRKDHTDQVSQRVIPQLETANLEKVR